MNDDKQIQWQEQKSMMKPSSMFKNHYKTATKSRPRPINNMKSNPMNLNRHIQPLTFNIESINQSSPPRNRTIGRLRLHRGGEAVNFSNSVVSIDSLQKLIGKYIVKRLDSELLRRGREKRGE
ncbi:unnamed protein product [Lactuca virosa]|uniref:Uncharacterized protein n=1 Tax=Lactuca virosa TaxID=75947 RepID=A0AAU9P7L5_9ASTR|nr:unnamed protein product [Lactuca virosa]